MSVSDHETRDLPVEFPVSRFRQLKATRFMMAIAAAGSSGRIRRSKMQHVDIQILRK